MSGPHRGDSGLERNEAQDQVLRRVQEAAPGSAYEPVVLAGCFELQEVIGGGGMAIVYRAWDRAKRRPCAVKVLADVLSRDEQFRLRFRQEAQAARGLTHAHIVAVYDYGESGPHHYIVMEYVARGTLRELLNRQRVLPEAAAAQLAADVADALAYAHARGVIHRDIKPQNILLTEGGAAKVADFGIARTLDATSLTRTGFVMGSVQYLSPEQARGDPAGPASDLYALGVVLFEMLAGRVPFEGDSAVGIALKHLGEPPPDLRRIHPDISEAMAAIVARLLAKSDANRYSTAASLAADLRGIASARTDHRPAAPEEATSGATRQFIPTPAPAGSSAAGRLPLSLVDTAPLSRVPDAPAGSAHLQAGGTERAVHGARGEATGVPSARARRGPRSRRWTAAVAMLLVLAAGGVGVRYLERWAPWHSMAARANTGATAAAPVDKGTTVPSLVGRTLMAASQAAGAAQLRVVVAESRQDPTAAAGTVLWQDPPAGGRLDKGAPLRVIVSQGSGIVPDLEGLSIAAATSRLESAGLRLGRSTESYGLGAETAGKILSQLQPPGARLTPGDSVDVIVSRGPMPSAPQSPSPAAPQNPAPPGPQAPTPPQSQGPGSPPSLAPAPPSPQPSNP